MDDITNAIRQLKSRVVLDVATGQGEFQAYLRGVLAQDVRLVGLDLAVSRLKQASANETSPETAWVAGEAAQLPFANATIDLVSISNSLHHLPDPAAVLGEMCRVVRPGGAVLISEMIRDARAGDPGTHVLLHHWWAAVDRARGVFHNRTYSRAELRRMLEALPLRNWQVVEEYSEDVDPREPSTLKQIAGICDKYLEMADKFDRSGDLVRRGQMLKQQLHDVGWQPATLVMALGQA